MSLVGPRASWRSTAHCLVSYLLLKEWILACALAACKQPRSTSNWRPWVIDASFSCSMWTFGPGTGLLLSKLVDYRLSLRMMTVLFTLRVQQWVVSWSFMLAAWCSVFAVSAAAFSTALKRKLSQLLYQRSVTCFAQKFMDCPLDVETSQTCGEWTYSVKLCHPVKVERTHS